MRVGECEVGDGGRAAERYGVDRGESVGQGRDVLDASCGLFGVASAGPGERPDAPAEPGRIDAVPDHGDHAGHLAARDQAFGEPVAGEGATTDHGIDSAYPDRLRAEYHLAGARDRIWEFAYHHS